VDKEIKYEELPVEMKKDWNEYLNSWRSEKMKILAITQYTIEADNLKNIIYKIYYEFSNFIGFADYRIRNEFNSKKTEFNVFSIDDVRLLLNNSEKLKGLCNKM
jgi:hypothetical protein